LISENLERVITINPRKKTLEEKKKHITKKKIKGAANPIPAAAPFSLFGFSSPVSISPPIKHFSFLNLNPQELQLLIKKEHITRENSIVHSHLILVKKEAWCFAFSFLPSSPSDQAQASNSSQQQQQSWLPPVTVTVEFHHHSRSSSSMVSFSATQQRRACPFSYNPAVRPASFLHQQLPGSPQLIFIPATSLQGYFFFSAVNCKENKINSPSNSNKLPPSAPATTALLNQRCNFFFSNTSSFFMQYSETSSMRSSKRKAGFQSMNSSFVFNRGRLSVQTQYLEFFLFSIEAVTAGAP
jgi:hypothetical protein